MTDDYRGATQYARAKRAQVTLNEMWAARSRDKAVDFARCCERPIKGQARSCGSQPTTVYR